MSWLMYLVLGFIEILVHHLDVDLFSIGPAQTLPTCRARLRVCTAADSLQLCFRICQYTDHHSSLKKCVCLVYLVHHCADTFAPAVAFAPTLNLWVLAACSLQRIMFSPFTSAGFPLSLFALTLRAIPLVITTV